jgi:hypothetical protein
MVFFFRRRNFQDSAAFSALSRITNIDKSAKFAFFMLGMRPFPLGVGSGQESVWVAVW